ncbi:MAG: hypothetical protein CVV05_01410 [Gammaproteobacteria bacterium HGW-Gammaproteobacteria-1]|jgi:hypothetical protein|nr:MAG: hypothetical protein CVV05_01410 [Gammaproteobacteria bacterium HGW-Gammaproteobacteria-1]
MKLDCSRISNEGDLLALIGIVVVAAVLAVAILLAIYIDAFWAGAFSATIVWKWRDWIYAPIDRVLNRLWSSNVAETEPVPRLLCRDCHHPIDDGDDAHVCIQCGGRNARA